MRSIEEWIDTAARQFTYIARAADLVSVANALVAANLIGIGQMLTRHQKLMSLVEKADRETLLLIARILFDAYPPHWLSNVVIGGTLAIEYIPDGDRETLEWLGPDLHDMLIDVHREKSILGEASLRKKLGDAGERVIVESKMRQGLRVCHVASISDSFGYDIEVTHSDGMRELIEVKATLSGGRSSFHISRNERDKAEQHPNHWNLVLVVFDAAAFWRGSIERKDVVSVQTLPNDMLLTLTAADNEHFRWEASAQVSPPDSAWVGYSNPLPEGFCISI